MNRDSLYSILKQLGIQHSSISDEGWVRALCPLARYTHAKGTDTNPSFAAKVEEGGISSFICLACHRHGRISSLIRALGHYHDKDLTELALAADMADAECAVTTNYEGLFSIPEEQKPEALDAAFWDGVYPPAWDNTKAREYLTSRRITRRTAEVLGLLWCGDESRVLFPVKGRWGELYGFAGRTTRPNGKPKVRNLAGLPKKHVLLGAHLWEEGRPTIVVEGLFALARLVECEFDKTHNLAATLGSTMSKQQANMIKEMDGPVVLMFDGDPAGREGIYGRGNSGGAYGLLQDSVPVTVPNYPEEKDDPDDLTREEISGMVIARSQPKEESQIPDFESPVDRELEDLLRL